LGIHDKSRYKEESFWNSQGKPEEERLKKAYDKRNRTFIHLMITVRSQGNGGYDQRGKRSEMSAEAEQLLLMGLEDSMSREREKSDRCDEQGHRFA
jgi:hypothetical protein